MSAKSFFAFVAMVICMGGSTAQAQWPTDPQTPLVLGQLLGVGPNHEVVTTPDGATWVAWIDHQCFASLRVQRISRTGTLQTPAGLALETRDNCDSLSPRIVALDDNTVILSAVNLPTTTQPVYRVDADGQQLWAPDVIADETLARSVERLMTFGNGDTLIAGKDMGTIKLGRYDAAGNAVWNPPTVGLASATSTNMRIFGLVPDGADGAYILYDSPSTYTRFVFAARIDELGAPVWASPLVMVPLPPGSSRHTDPVALADGLGGLLLVWTQGVEQGASPVPIRMQHVDAAGNTLLAPEGARISLSAARQFDVRVTGHATTDDIFVVWRDGPFSGQSIRAQRMSLAGVRLWGDNGILITDVNDLDSQYSISSFDVNTLAIAVGDTPVDAQNASVMLYRIDTMGQQASATIALSGNADADSIQSVTLDDALTVVWQRDATGNQNELVAQRVRADGTLGLTDTDGDGVDDAADNCLTASNSDQRDSNDDGFGNVCDADLNNDCVVNVVDLGLMRTDFFGPGPDADLDGDGVVNVVDLGLLRQAFFRAPGPSGLNDTCPNEKRPTVAAGRFIKFYLDAKIS